MLGIFDYIIIGILVITLLIAAYFRRERENKKRMYLSYSLLISSSLSIVGYFFLFYILGNYDKFLITHILSTLLIIVVSILFALYKYKNENENK